MASHNLIYINKFCKDIFSIILYHFYLPSIFQNNSRLTFWLTYGLSRQKDEEGQRNPWALLEQIDDGEAEKRVIRLERCNFIWTLILLYYCTVKPQIPTFETGKMHTSEFQVINTNCLSGLFKIITCSSYIYVTHNIDYETIMEHFLCTLSKEAKECTIIKTQKDWGGAVLLPLCSNHQLMSIINVFNQPCFSCDRYILSHACTHTYSLC